MDDGIHTASGLLEFSGGQVAANGLRPCDRHLAAPAERMDAIAALQQPASDVSAERARRAGDQYLSHPLTRQAWSRAHGEPLVDDRCGVRRGLRVGLVALALPSVTIGGWALLAPRSFYADFPLPELAWVSRLPPFNEHLTTDVGGLYLAIAVLVLWAARTLSPELVRAVLVAHIVFALPHFLWHAFQGLNPTGRRFDVP